MNEKQPVKYGLKTSRLVLAWGILVSIMLYIFISLEAFLAMFIGLAALTFYLSVIHIEKEKLVFSHYLNPFWKNDIIPLKEIDKIFITPDWFVGRTEYRIHCKGGGEFHTFNKLLASERRKLVTALKAKGIEVIVYDAHTIW